MDTIRDRSTRYGLFTILGGMVLLLGLRLWTSPLVRIMTGRESNSLFAFLSIPLFMIVVGIGVLLFLWEPGEGR